jgi:hypothetical protein
MERQKKMEESFLLTHREFVKNLADSIKILQDDLTETTEMERICTDEWCLATESTLDEVAKMVFSISEPRWCSDADSRRIVDLRHQVHDLYAKYKNVRA